MIKYDKIYNQAITLFDDPELTESFYDNKISFFKMMYPFLSVSSSLFTQPFLICEILSDRTEPNGTTEIFTSDGVATSYILSFIPIADSVYEYRANGNIIDGTYDSTSNTVTFSEVIPLGQEYSFESYYTGKFNSNFELTAKTTLDNTIQNQVVSILARMLVKTWGESKRNFLLDIQNILKDSEFSLHPASSALSSKDKWIAHLDEEINQIQNKLCYNIRFASSSNWVRRYN